jgi:signal transduction histidine kinase
MLSRSSIVFSFFLLLIPVDLFAQNLSVIDSLKSKLQASGERDQFDILCSIGFEYRYSFPDSTIHYCTKAYELGKKIDIQKNLSRPLSFLGLAYTNRGDYKKSLQFHEQAIQIAAEQNDSLQLGHSYNNLGRMFLDGGDWVRAFNNFLRSQEIFESLDDKPGMAYVYRSLANIYMAQKDYVKALEMSEKAYQIRKELGDKRGVISSLIEFGLLYQANGVTRLALEKFKEANELARNIDDRVTIAELAMAMAEIQLVENQFGQALENADNVLKTISETSNQKLFIRALIIKSKVLIHDEECLKAIPILDKVLVESRNSGNLIYELEALELGALCYEKSGRIDRAQHYRNDYALLSEKIKNTDLLREIDRLQFQLLIEKFETENKNLKAIQINNESLISRQRFQNIILTITVISFLIISAILFLYSRKRKIVNHKLSQKNEKISSQQKAISETNEMLIARNKDLNELNNEKDSLMSIVAHDLKAPLNRITGLTRLLEMEGDLSTQQKEYLGMIKIATKSGSDLITDLLDVNYLNESVHKPASVLIDLKMLLENRIKSYKISADFKSIQIDFSHSIESAVYTVPDYLNRIVDNLLSNAIKFSDKQSTVTIHGEVENGWAIISIRDSGPGFTDEDKNYLFQRFKKLSARPTGGESSNGLGLAIVKTLVDRLQGEIKLNSHVGEGAEFIVRIPSAGSGEL